MRVVQGKDAGFIKFGSRVDIYLPLELQLMLSLEIRLLVIKLLLVKKNK